jgi:hypothetical protein
MLIAGNEFGVASNQNRLSRFKTEKTHCSVNGRLALKRGVFYIL